MGEGHDVLAAVVQRVGKATGLPVLLSRRTCTG